MNGCAENNYLPIHALISNVKRLSNFKSEQVSNFLSVSKAARRRVLRTSKSSVCGAQRLTLNAIVCCVCEFSWSTDIRLGQQLDFYMKHLGRSTRSGRVRKRQGCRLLVAHSARTHLSSTTFIIVQCPRPPPHTIITEPALICVKADLFIFSTLLAAIIAAFRSPWTR